MSTKILYKLNSSGNFNYLVIKGHTNYAEKGQDIVCAAISAVTNGTTNFIKLYYSCKIDYLKAKIIIYPPNKKDCQLCLQLMLYQLKNIANFYPENLIIKQKK